MKENRTREAVIADIIKYFEENEDVFNECIEQLDGYNGYLGDDRYYDMYEIDELYSGENASEILARAFYGRDDDTWRTYARGEDAYGEKEYGPFNPNRNYFYYNGYGNLVSTDYKDYSDKLNEYAVESMAENRTYIDAIDDDETLEELFDELDSAEEEE